MDGSGARQAAAGEWERDGTPTGQARELQRARARLARVAHAARGAGRHPFGLLPAAGRRARGVRAPGRAATGRRAPAGFPAPDCRSGRHFLRHGAGFGDDLHAGSLRPVLAVLRREAHFGADRKAVEVAVQHAVPVEVDLPVVAELAQEAVAFVEQLLDDAVRLPVVAHLAAAQLRGLLELALDSAERKVDG